MKSIKYLPGFIAISLLLFSTQIAIPQYFGRNKVNYDQFDFKIYNTPHFQIYHYLENDLVLNNFAQLCERWYSRHQAVFLDTLPKKNPIILYNNHADFQQTTVIQSLIGVGTGGVTEGLRNRVVMPVMMSNAETNHVLGHELVHVFQYNSFKQSDSLSLQTVGNVPLWMIEGLAEYMSIGKEDIQTTMWLRDAIINDNIPTLEDMTKEPHKYFPYRYGHAFWVYVTSNWGDAVIRPILMASARRGYKKAIDSLLGYTTDTLSMMWKKTLLDDLQPVNAKEGPVGKKILAEEDLGKINIAPSLSPDGRYLIFLSDKDVITTDFYLASVKKRRIVRKLTRVVRDAHIDDYSYLESKGTWSPDNERFALTSFMDGKNKLVVLNINSLKPEQIYDFSVPEFFNNPSWAPNEDKVVVSGLQSGQSDLYILDLKNDTAIPLTNDMYSDLQPNWSPDGKSIVFISDRAGETDFDQVKYGNYHICIYNLEKDNIKILNIFPGISNTNPRFSPDGKKIYFISAANGIPNIYEYDMAEAELYRLSNFKTGISGITELSPALTTARDTSLMAYIYRQNNGYSLCKASPGVFNKKKVDPGAVDQRAAVIPPSKRSISTRVVDRNLEAYPIKTSYPFKKRPYESKFSLEYVGSSGVGVGFSQTTTALAGGVSFLFSDMLKRNQLFTSLSIYGEIYDIGGQALYINQASRFNWGVSYTHVPYRSTRAFLAPDTLDEVPVRNLIYLRQRIFQDELGLFAQYPISKKLRIEGGLSSSLYSFRIDSINNYYLGGYRLEQDKTKLDAPEPYFIHRTYVAYVGDDSFFGLTSPLRGYRYRVQLGRTFGRIRFWDFLADYRKYFFFKPIGLGFRVMHAGRYGGNSEELYPYFIGYPYYVRGYSYNSFYKSDCYTGNCLNVNQIGGSKMALINGEIRYPFTGPKRLALIKSGMFFTDLVLFIDAGLAWYEFDNIRFSWKPTDNEHHIPIVSTGISVRFNLFGAIIVEPFYAIPLQREDIKGGKLGFFLSAGGW